MFKNIPFVRIEKRVVRASKIVIEARMQNIITESAVVVKFIGFLESNFAVKRLQDRIQYQGLSFSASFYIAWLDVRLEE